VPTSPELLIKHGDMSLGLSEAFIVWEPISQVQGVQVTVARRTLKHSFLVFALEAGQVLYGNEYRYMRVERQPCSCSRPGGTPQRPLLQVSNKQRSQTSFQRPVLLSTATSCHSMS
jgi:hypothetical protein